MNIWTNQPISALFFEKYSIETAFAIEGRVFNKSSEVPMAEKAFGLARSLKLRSSLKSKSKD